MRELERNPTRSAALRDGVGVLPPLAVIGAGRAGTSIAAAARSAGADVRLAGREHAAAAAAAADAVLLCVPDAAIAAACEVATAAKPHPRFVGHASGARGLDALGAARANGISTFGLHPLQTIPDGEALLAGSACAVSGSDADALSLATSLAELLGMHPFEIEDDQRAAYHAAASMASNFLVALEESAAELLEAAGVEDGRELLAPLVERTVTNWSRQGGTALTGPIARGDEATVAKHREALADRAPRLLPLYDELAARTRELARAPVT